MSSKWWTLSEREAEDGRLTPVSLSSEGGAYGAFQQAKWLAGQRRRTIYIQGPDEARPSSLVTRVGRWLMLKGDHHA
jgi:hypothetical protein